MKILYITTEGFDTINANNHLNSSLIEDLLKRGHNVTLYQSKRSENSSIPAKLSIFPNFISIAIKRLKVNKNRMITRGFNEIKYYKDVLRDLKNRSFEHDIIYYQSSGLSYYLLPRLNRILRKPIVMNIQDLFPDSVKTTRKYYLYPIILIIEVLQQMAYKHVSKFIVISDDIAGALFKKGINHNKVCVIQNWYDNEEVFPVSLENNKFSYKYKINKGKFTIQYAGNIGYVLDYDFIVRLALNLQANENIVFQIIGGGSNKDKLEKLCAKNHLINVEFFPIQPLEIVRDVYSYADLCLIPLKRGVIYHSVPSKASVAMACGTPILVVADNDSIYSKEINSSNIGMCVNSDEVAKAVTFILDLASDKSKHNLYKKNAIEYSSKKLSRIVNTSKVIELIETKKD